jgi:hypothetical protein
VRPLLDWLRQVFSKAEAEIRLPPERLLDTEAWRQATQALSKGFEEVFASTTQLQDAVFQVSLGLTGAGGEAVLQPDPGSTGKFQIKKHNALPVILDESARAAIMGRVELPRSHSSTPVIKVSARIRLEKKTILNRSIPLWKIQTVYILTIVEL